jgi:hypothetical protein
VSDATIVLCAAWCGIGWLTGCACILTVCWRRITRPGDATVRLLRMQIDDDMKQQGRQQNIIDELTAQVAQLYRDSDRLARRYVELAGRTREKVT